MSDVRSEGERRRKREKEDGGKRKQRGRVENRGPRGGGEGGSGGIVGIGNVASSLVVAAGPEGMLREGMGCQATYVHP